MSLKSKLVHMMMILKNHHTDKHIVVFESDDWGSIRMPSLQIMNHLQHSGIELCLPESYDCFDTLASNNDLECLIEVLSSFKDEDGSPAKLTMNTCVANPDFQKIKNSDFTTYFYEPFTETLKRYPHHDKAFDLWKLGINENVFKPQFHGREHINYQKWMRYLQNNAIVQKCFDYEVISLLLKENGRTETFLAAYNITSEEEKVGVSKSIEDGLRLFKSIFGFESNSMIAPCYTWDDYIEDIAAKHGVKYIQGGYIQSHSAYQKSKNGKKFTGHFIGETNKLGQKYLIRNCSFEPSQDKKFNADSCLHQIDIAFRMKMPAIISCHRLNFIGELNPSNRDNNLKEFRYLLKTLLAKYPDIQFRFSDELFE